MALYIPNINSWINHFTRKSHDKVQLLADPNAIDTGNGNVGLAMENFMPMSQVEPQRPSPVVPTTGTTALRTIAPSEGTLQQAMLDAKRTQIENRHEMANTYAPDYRKSTKSKGKNKGKGEAGRKRKLTKKELFGTPGDIFKTKLDSKHPKKKKKSN